MLVLQSNFVPENQAVDTTWISMANNIKTLHYVPSASTDKPYFEACKAWYKDLGIPNILQFDIDTHYDKDNMEELFSADAIFLSGGNTFYFLSLFQKHNLIDPLRKYVQDGGICIGVSAGAILMSETIGIAELCDDNTIDIHDLSAIHLMDFEFFPHFVQESDMLLRLQNRANMTQKSIYACKDGDGIIVHNNSIHTIGDVRRIHPK